jgi:peptide/nickel transport system permease protein
MPANSLPSANASPLEDDGGATLASELPSADAPPTATWRAVRRQLVRRPAAMLSAGLFCLILTLCACAPLYARYVAHTGPNENHLSAKIIVDGRTVPVVSQGGATIEGGKVAIRAGGAPIGPQWLAAGGRYVLGADENGRDVAVRLLYGGLTSLKISLSAAAGCVLIALAMSLLAAYFGGAVDWAVSRFFEVMWAFPVMLLGVALGAALAIDGFHHFGIDIESGSLLIPIGVIGFAFIPYVGRPLRGQLLSLRERAFVEAAIADGVPGWRIMLLELAPNVISTVLVFFALTVATDIILEAGLSYLGAGVQPPNASWGTLIAEGKDRIVTAPWLALLPGLAMLLTALSLNVFTDTLRDALDPRSGAA